MTTTSIPIQMPTLVMVSASVQFVAAYTQFDAALTALLRFLALALLIVPGLHPLCGPHLGMP